VRARILALVVTLMIGIAVSAFAAELPLPAGHERYIVVLKRAADSAKTATAEIMRLGGTVEADLGDRIVVILSSGAIDELSALKVVSYVQMAVVGAAAPESPHRREPRALSVNSALIEGHTVQTWTTGDYAYDGAGNIAAIGTSAFPGTQGYRTYGYDKVARLTKAEITPTDMHEYGYDVYGNRTSSAVNQQWTNVGVDTATNHFTDATYDPATGSQLVRGSTIAAYDGFGMMTSYHFDGTNVETFVYTASDERIGVLRNTDWTWSLRGGDGKVLRQYRSSFTNPSATWLWVEDSVYRGGLILGGERVPAQGGRRHYHLDHLGSPRLVTNASGLVLSEHDFLPFGEERTAISQHVPRGYDREEPFRFTGHERDFDIPEPNDSSSYIDYMHARYYSAEAGRFLSVDPVLQVKRAMRNPQGWNRYAYAFNNPLKYTDPTGRTAELPANCVDQKCKELADLRNTVPVELRIFVRARTVDGKVVVDARYLNMKRDAVSGNFQALRQVANSPGVAMFNSSVTNVQSTLGTETIGRNTPTDGITFTSSQSLSGKIEVYVAGNMGAVDTAETAAHELRHARRLLLGLQAQHEMMTAWDGNTITISTDPNGPVNIETKAAQREASENYDPFLPPNE